MPMEMNELYHHGILGMHWGIRRFQPYPSGYNGKGKYTGPKFSLTKNIKKGHITTKGLKELNALTSSESAKAVNKRHNEVEAHRRKELGIQQLDEKTDLIKSGTGITRVSNEEELSDRRKYVSLTDSWDAYDYVNHPLHLGTDRSEKIYNYSYELKKDIKVAPAEEVRDYIMEKYGEVLVKDLKINDVVFEYQFTPKGVEKAKEALKEVGNIKVNEFLRETDQYETVIRMRRQQKITDDNWALGRAGVGHETLLYLMNKNLMVDKNAMNDVCETFKNRGYDAIVDAEDKLSGYDYPLILLNPGDSLTLKSKELIWPKK